MILLLKLMLMLGTMAAATMTTPMMTSMTTPSSGPGLHAEEPAAQERRDRAMRAMTAEESDEEEEDLAHVRRAHEHNRSPAEHPGALYAAQLAATLLSEQKQMLGEKLFPAIYEIHPRLAGKITGMILQMDNSELLRMRLRHHVPSAGHITSGGDRVPGRGPPGSEMYIADEDFPRATRVNN
jgi:hypothetical protein